MFFSFFGGGFFFSSHSSLFNRIFFHSISVHNTNGMKKDDLFRANIFLSSKTNPINFFTKNVVKTKMFQYYNY